MKPIAFIVGAVFFVVALGDAAWAQIPQYQAGPATGQGGPTLKRSTRPVVSAYAGLLGSGVGAQSGVGYQYFTRVQPQISAARGLSSLGRSVNRLNSQTSANGASLLQQEMLLQQMQGMGAGLGTTGHPTGYFSHTRYFATNTQGGTIGSTGSGLGGLGGLGGGLGGIPGSSPGFGSAGLSSGSPLRH
jgi:hypothetical protein